MSERPRYDLLCLGADDPAVLARDPHLRALAEAEVEILERIGPGGGRIIDRCAVSRDYRRALRRALGMPVPD